MFKVLGGGGGCRSEGQAKGSFYSTLSHPHYSVSETSDCYTASAPHSIAFPKQGGDCKDGKGCCHERTQPDDTSGIYHLPGGTGWGGGGCPPGLAYSLSEVAVSSLIFPSP